MMEAVSTSETSVNFYQTTQRTTTEDSHLQARFQVFTAASMKMRAFRDIAVLYRT
jgi:GH25 family lysozyme M1 (1,4-beta-N-acetylmuramidase)